LANSFSQARWNEQVKPQGVANNKSLNLKIKTLKKKDADI